MQSHDGSAIFRAMIREAKRMTGIGDRHRGISSILLLLATWVGGCGGREVIGFRIGGNCTDDADAHAPAFPDASDSCPPSTCSIIGAFHNFGGPFYLDGGAPACAEGAIRFDATGAFSVLTSSGWIGACSYSVCGDQVYGSQLASVFAARLEAVPCGPVTDVSISEFKLFDGGLLGCAINVSAPCRPPAAGTTLLYSACTP
jgi:hypothetical protein